MSRIPPSTGIERPIAVLTTITFTLTTMSLLSFFEEATHPEAPPSLQRPHPVYFCSVIYLRYKQLRAEPAPDLPALSVPRDQGRRQQRRTALRLASAGQGTSSTPRAERARYDRWLDAAFFHSGVECIFTVYVHGEPRSSGVLECGCRHTAAPVAWGSAL